MENQTKRTADLVADYVSALEPTALFNGDMDRALRSIAYQQGDSPMYALLESIPYGRTFTIAGIGYFYVNAHPERAHEGMVRANSIRRIKMGAPRLSYRNLTYSMDCIPETVKLGKILKLAFPDVADHHIAALVDGYKGRYDMRLQFQIVSEEDIRYWYHEDRIHGDRDTYSLAQSCMRHSRCQSYLDIYVENEDAVSLVIATMGDQLVARALLWTTIDGRKVLDRVYGNGADSTALSDYVKEQYPDVQSRYCDATIELSSWNFNEYPYMDTFEYLNLRDGTLTYNSPDSSVHYYSLKSTYGGYDENLPRTCDHCGDGITAYGGYDVSGLTVCYSCYDDSNICDVCEERHLNGGSLCERHENYVECGICGMSYDPAELADHCMDCHEDNGPWELYYGPFLAYPTVEWAAENNVSINELHDMRRQIAFNYMYVQWNVLRETRGY